MEEEKNKSVEVAAFIERYQKLEPDAKKVLREFVGSAVRAMGNDYNKIETGQIPMESMGMNMLSMTGARLAILQDIRMLQRMIGAIDPEWVDVVPFEPEPDNK